MTAAANGREPIQVEDLTDQRVARNVRAEMARAGMSQGEIGTLLDLSQQAVSKRLTCVTPFTVSQLGRLASRFQMTIGELADGVSRGPSGPGVAIDRSSAADADVIQFTGPSVGNDSHCDPCEAWQETAVVVPSEAA